MLGPRKKTEIPMEVYDDHGHVNNDVNCVLNTWSKEYETLFKGYNVDDFDSAFYNFALGKLRGWNLSNKMILICGITKILKKRKLNLWSKRPD